MPEVRLPVEEQDGGDALAANDRERPSIQLAGHDDAEDGRHDDPAQPPARDAYRVAPSLHRWSRRMNSANGESSKRIEDLGTSMRGSGPCNSPPRRTSRVSGALSGSVCVCCR